MRRDLAWLAAQIWEIVQASSLSRRDKLDIGKNIDAIGGVVDAVAVRQNENEPLPADGEAHGNDVDFL